MNYSTHRLITIIIILISLIISMAIIWIGTVIQSNIWKSFLLTMGTIILTSGVFSLIGAYIARLEISNWLAEKFGLNRTMTEAGIRNIGFWPFDFPQNALKIDILVARGHSWIDLEAPNIFRCLKNEGSEVRLCIVHPKSKMIEILSNKYREETEEARVKILSTIKTVVQHVEELKRECNGNLPGRLLLKAHMLPTPYTYYRFDDLVFIVWYAFRRGRFNVPYLQLTDGTITTFFKDDFDRLLEESDTVIVYDTNSNDQFNIEQLTKIGLKPDELSLIGLHDEKKH